MNKKLMPFALAAILLAGLVASAAPTIVSPADYATISTMSASLKSFKGTSAMVSYATYKSSTKDSATRVGYENDYMANSIPVELHWSGTSGSCAVKVWRTHKDSSATPVFSTNVTGTSVIFYDPEIGRNYTWTDRQPLATSSPSATPRASSARATTASTSATAATRAAGRRPPARS